MLFKDHFLKQLNNKIKACQDCKLKDNKGPVLGYGGQEADIMFIGDVTKESDLTAMVPFTGTSKDKMITIIKELGLKKGEYYFTYFIKHVITGNNKPDFMNIKPCLDILLEEIEIVDPRIICSMGHYSTKYLMQAYDMEEQGISMTKLHGNSYPIPGKTFYKTRYKKREPDRPKRYLIPTWSPAVDNILMDKDIMNDVIAIKTVQKLKTLLFS